MQLVKSTQLATGRSPSTLTAPIDAASPRIGSVVADVDFRQLLEAVPGLYLILKPDLTIVAVSDTYLRATMTTRDGIVGRGIFDVFPDNPGDPGADGVGNLRASLQRVLAQKATDIMALQRYDIRRPDSAGGDFEQRYWSPVNSPVLSESGEVRYIIHRVEDVTAFMRGRESVHENELRIRTEHLEAEIFQRALELQDANRKLRSLNADLEREVASRAALEREATRARSFFDSIVENIPAMIFVKDAAELRFVHFNRAGEELLGYSRDDLLGKNDYDFFPLDEAESYIAKDREVLSSRAVVDIPDEPIQTREKGERRLHTRKISICDEQGQPRYLLGISEDITEQKEAEQALRQLNADLQRRTAELETANKELEAFSYSVSHDLRAPLRAINGFSRLLLERREEEMPAECLHYLRRIATGSQRLGQLIDDLLKFARLSRQPIAKEQVSPATIARDVLAQLSPDENGRTIKTLLPDLPSCQADPSLLRQVYANLLGNALKYTRKREIARIEIGSYESGGEDVYFVRDNGAGFDMRYSNKLFGVFQRLHPAEDYEGTGVGLATVQRIIQRHGGAVWADARVDEGATFFFTLTEPANSPL